MHIAEAMYMEVAKSMRARGLELPMWSSPLARSAVYTSASNGGALAEVRLSCEIPDSTLQHRSFVPGRIVVNIADKAGASCKLPDTDRSAWSDNLP